MGSLFCPRSIIKKDNYPPSSKQATVVKYSGGEEWRVGREWSKKWHAKVYLLSFPIILGSVLNTRYVVHINFSAKGTV